MNKSVLGVILVSVIAISNLLAGCISEQSSDNKTQIAISPFDTTIPEPVSAAGDTFWWEPVFEVQPGAVDIPVSGAVVVGIATDDEDGELRVEVGTDPTFGPNVPKIEIKVRDLERTGNNEYRFTWPDPLEYATVYYCRARLTAKHSRADWVNTSFTTEAKPLPSPTEKPPQESSEETPIIDIGTITIFPPTTTTAGGDSIAYITKIGGVDIPVSGAVVVGIATDDEDGELRVEVGTGPSFAQNVADITARVSELEKTGEKEYRYIWPGTLEYATVYYCRAKLTTKYGEIGWVTSNFTTEAKPLPGQ